jgi:chromosome segregation ATPase
MNELSPPTQSPQETVVGQLPFDVEELNKLPFDSHELVIEIRTSADRVNEFEADCQADLAAERERLSRIEEVSDEAIQHGGGLQAQQLETFNALAQASVNYLKLVADKQTMTTVVAEKQVELAKEHTIQAQSSDRAYELQARLNNSATNTAGYNRSLQEGRTNLGSELFYAGAKISKLQSDLNNISTDQLPALEAEIAREAKHITQLRAAISASSEQIEQLVAPADDPENQELFRVSGGARHSQQVTAAVESPVIAGLDPAASETPPTTLPAPRPRVIGEVAVRLVGGGRLSQEHVQLIPVTH